MRWRMNQVNGSVIRQTSVTRWKCGLGVIGVTQTPSGVDFEWKAVPCARAAELLGWTGGQRKGAVLSSQASLRAMFSGGMGATPA